MTAMTDTTTTESTPQPVCRNCGTALLGEHCYACGQPVKGLVRPLGNLFGDLLDSVFNIDTRILRTLGPLFTKPGFLSTEYFAGRQVRYVTPVRLFFFLAIVTFFLAQLTIDGPNIGGAGENDGNIDTATTVAEVEKRRDAGLAELAKAKERMRGTPAASGIAGIEEGEEDVRRDADRRIKQLQEAQAKGLPPPAAKSDGINFDYKGKSWDAKANPVDFTLLPDFADHAINARMARASDNVSRLKKDPSAFKDAVLSAVPTTLFVLVPIFALMLKLIYFFKRRLYMEHVVVALHSHAFLCLDLLLVLLVRALDNAIGSTGFVGSLFGWIEGLLLAWMPVYLLIMQKRVYAQGWPMTLLKYCTLGFCYSFLLGFAIAASALIGLVAM